MRATKQIVASLIAVVGLLSGCAVVPRDESNAKNVAPVIAPVLDSAEKSITEIKPEPKPVVDLGNLYTSMEQDVKDLKKEVEAKAPAPKPVVKPVPVKPVVKPAPKPVPAKPAPVIAKPIVKPPATAPPAKPALPTLPKNAVPLIPKLLAVLQDLWPKLSMRSFMASKIEQETCISLTHSLCWNTNAELKVKYKDSNQLREWGFGLPMATTKYDKNGKEIFNVWKELIAGDKLLKEKWTWDNRFDPDMQLRATVIKSKASYDSVRFTVASEREHLAFGAVTYNSGSVLVDRQICVNTKGCDPSKWFGNVELYSSKSRVIQKGYGQSFFDISRTYPRNILDVRRPKYVPYMDN